MLNLLKYSEDSETQDTLFRFFYDMYHFLLRFDDILLSENEFELNGVKVLDEWKYSDYYPIVANLNLRRQ